MPINTLDLSIASTLIVNSLSAGASPLSARYLELFHSPENDGINPYVKIGEIGTLQPVFSGFHFEYNENTNSLILSSVGFTKAKTVATFDSNNRANFNSVSYNLTAVDFSTVGTTIYTLPDLTNYSWVKIICVGGGGGGGAGRKEVTDNLNARYGGGGAAGGDYTDVVYPISYISGNTTATIIVGAGGTGGPAQSTDATNGANGTVGGTTSVIFTTNGVTVSALGGLFGYGGTTASGTGGQSPGIGGKGGESSVSRTAREGSGTSIGGGGGGGGGGVSISGATDYNGGDAYPGGAIGGRSGLILGGVGAGSNGTSAPATTQVPNALFVVCGTGGSGGSGARSGVNPGGSGGNGASPGGGGGGGGASGRINVNSGAGGNGGAGFVRIIFY